MINLVVGQKLWWVNNRNRPDAYEVVVTKVGRKWATIDDRHRIDLSTLHADRAGYSSPGRCYLSRTDWEAETALNAAWEEFRREVGNIYRRPAYVTLENIATARKA